MLKAFLLVVSFSLLTFREALGLDISWRAVLAPAFAVVVILCVQSICAIVDYLIILFGKE